MARCRFLAPYGHIKTGICKKMSSVTISQQFLGDVVTIASAVGVLAAIPNGYTLWDCTFANYLDKATTGNIPFSDGKWDFEYYLGNPSSVCNKYPKSAPARYPSQTTGNAAASDPGNWAGKYALSKGKGKPCQGDKAGVQPIQALFVANNKADMGRAYKTSAATQGGLNVGEDSFAGTAFQNRLQQMQTLYKPTGKVPDDTYEISISDLKKYIHLHLISGNGDPSALNSFPFETGAKAYFTAVKMSIPLTYPNTTYPVNKNNTSLASSSAGASYLIRIETNTCKVGYVIVMMVERTIENTGLTHDIGIDAVIDLRNVLGIGKSATNLADSIHNGCGGGRTEEIIKSIMIYPLVCMGDPVPWGVCVSPA